MKKIVFLYIFAAIIAIVLLMLFLPFTLVIKYNESFSVYVRFLFFKYSIFPSEKKRINTSRHREKNINKQKAREKKKLSKKKKSPVSSEENKRTYSDTVELVQIIYDTVLMFFEKFNCHLRIKLADLDIIVGSDDSCKTALLFGAVNSAVVALVSLLESFTGYEKCSNKNIRVRADFLSEKISASADIRFSVNLFGVIASLLHSSPHIKKLISKI